MHLRLSPGFFFFCAKSDGLVPDSSYILALLFECSQVSGHCDLLRKRDPKGQWSIIRLLPPQSKTLEQTAGS